MFSYVADDGYTVSDPALVMINVVSVNDVPTLVPFNSGGAVSTTEATPVTVTLDGGADADGDALTEIFVRTSSLDARRGMHRYRRTPPPRLFVSRAMQSCSA